MNSDEQNAREIIARMDGMTSETDRFGAEKSDERGQICRELERILRTSRNPKIIMMINDACMERMRCMDGFMEQMAWLIGIHGTERHFEPTLEVLLKTEQIRHPIDAIVLALERIITHTPDPSHLARFKARLDNALTDDSLADKPIAVGTGLLALKRKTIHALNPRGNMPRNPVRTEPASTRDNPRARMRTG